MKYLLFSFLLLTSCQIVATGVSKPILLVPVYESKVGSEALKTHQTAPICMILNPNSGPGLKMNPEYQKLFNSSEKRVAYIDLKAFPRDGIITTSKERWKTVDELQKEKDLYKSNYKHISGWFFDDADKVPTSLMNEIKKWNGKLILNPGYPSDIPDGFSSIQWENKDYLKSNSIKNPEKSGVIALEISEKDLKSSIDKNKNLEYFYASELSDDWKKGQTAYNTLPKYWKKLVEYFK
jgi:hypothetical protein